MKKARFLSAVLTVLLLVSALVGCAGGPAGGGPITATDMMGREISLDGPATKVVALSAADCEILYALGAGDMVAGRGAYCDYPPEVLEVESVESGFETNAEQIIALQPQVVFMSTMNQATGPVEQLENAGIVVVVSEAFDIAGVYESIQLIGKVVGKDKEAGELVQQMKTGFEEIAAKVPQDAGEKSVYFEVSPLEYGLWAAGAGTFMDEAAGMLGMTNIFGDLEGWAEVSQEQVIDRDPAYIVTIAMGGEGLDPKDEISARAGWEEVAAVRDGSILFIGGNELSRPGPRLVEGVQLMYDLVYGAAA